MFHAIVDDPGGIGRTPSVGGGDAHVCAEHVLLGGTVTVPAATEMNRRGQTGRADGTCRWDVQTGLGTQGFNLHANGFVGFGFKWCFRCTNFLLN